MWVTQTYLGNVEHDSNVFIYYLFENYDIRQKEFTENVQKILEDMGIIYKANASLFMPNPEYAASDEFEIRGINELWNSLTGKLPGIFISTIPLSKFDLQKGDYYFASLFKTNPTMCANIIRDIKSLIDDSVSQAENTDADHEKNFYKRLYEAIEATPEIYGFNIDLKKISD
jgi:hypothetical protein